ncbi:hypothetical protein [Pseudomonas sp. 22 E 5]|nr:hypothetical protein [Pseudomonas sp. 22 E 5]
MAVARPRHGQEHREVPEQDLQQRRNVAEHFHIHRRQLVDHPVRRQSRHADDKAEQGSQDHADEGHQQGVEQADYKDAGIAVRFGVVDQVLRDAEAGTALKKVETRGNASVLKVGLGIVEEVPAQRDHRHNRDDLEEPRTHFGIAEAELLLWCADLILHEVPRKEWNRTSPGGWPTG